jgi:hypothetical protein
MDEPSMGLSPLPVKEVFGHHPPPERGTRHHHLLVEQNARMALSVASFGYVMEQGKVVLDGTAEALASNEDVKEFYLGGHGADRKSFRNLNPTSGGSAGCDRPLRRAGDPHARGPRGCACAGPAGSHRARAASAGLCGDAGGIDPPPSPPPPPSPRCPSPASRS